MNWERARSTDQKQIRINSLLKATGDLFAEQRFEDISLMAIAKAAGFTRSNLYKYFSSKEDIFLALLQADLAIWSQQLHRQLQQAAYPNELTVFAQIWTEVTCEHQRMLRLFGVAFTFLEVHASVESLLAYKRFLAAEAASLHSLLCKCFGSLSPEQSLGFLSLQMALASGLYPMTQLPAAKQAALQAAQLDQLDVDFAKSFQLGLEALTLRLLAPA